MGLNVQRPAGDAKAFLFTARGSDSWQGRAVIESLHTPRLILRPWRAADLPAFAALNADLRVMEWMPGRLTQEQSDATAERIRGHFDQHGYGLWAVEVPGRADFIGFIGLSIPRWEAAFLPGVEIGWRLAAEYWGRGYATEGARVALAHGFGRLGLREILSFTVAANVRSRAVMERIGMRRDPEDFDHPMLPEGHPLRRHVLYRMGAKDYAARGQDGSL